MPPPSNKHTVLIGYGNWRYKRTALWRLVSWMTDEAHYHDWQYLKNYTHFPDHSNTTKLNMNKENPIANLFCGHCNTNA